MHTYDHYPKLVLFISGAVIALIIIAPLVALAAWSEPSQAPTGGNPDPPINTGSSNQVKNGGLSVTGFAVFGNTSLNGNTYLKTASPAPSTATSTSAPTTT